MCRRVDCLLAVNGSFRDIPSRLPRGGEVVGGVPVQLRAQEWRQAVFSSRRPVQVGRLQIRIRLGQPGVGWVRIGGVNVVPGHHGATMFTSHFGTHSPRGLTLPLRLRSAAHFRVGHTYRVRAGTADHRSRALHESDRPVVVAKGRQPTISAGCCATATAGARWC